MNEAASEWRLFARFPARDHAMIAINSLRGELIDISFGGLALPLRAPSPGRAAAYRCRL
jgi:hypothetical protein